MPNQINDNLIEAFIHLVDDYEQQAKIAAEIAAAIRTETHNIDKDLPVTDIESFPEAMHASLAEPRFRTVLLGLFSAIALSLAAIGIFGVISFSVSRRTREIGVRMALGATPASIRHLVIGESARLALFGLAAGIPAALILTHFLSALLFGVTPTDPLTFIGVALLLMLVALAAAYLPAAFVCLTTTSPTCLIVPRLARRSLCSGDVCRDFVS